METYTTDKTRRFNKNKSIKFSEQFDYVNRQFGYIISRLEQLHETGLEPGQNEHVDSAIDSAYKGRNALARISIAMLDLIPRLDGEDNSL